MLIGKSGVNTTMMSDGAEFIEGDTHAGLTEILQFFQAARSGAGGGPIR
ncbi:MAG: hypothetical protein IPJ38_23150 [Dechloromonas sp.]|uniref:Uncharacterized protein n=1 Tax=Candidatus Dechloromonas phosphorivorans TaxID=2899244 RepID=A0A935MVC6_9RHOO|nr:hypothetical protein [Candidatus Dechloromonas phosphorivorans]